MGTYTDNLEFYMPVGHEGLIGTPYTDALNDNWVKLDLLFSTQAVNVMDPRFGAAGDGTTDDTAACVAAIAALPAYSGGVGGGVVYLPRHHKISASLVVPSGVTLMGAGRRSSRITGSFNGPLLTSTSNGGADPLTNFVTIRDLFLHHTGTGASARAFYFHQIARLEMVRCTSQALPSGGAIGQLRAAIVSSLRDVALGGAVGAEACLKLESANNLITLDGCSFTDGKAGLNAFGGTALNVRGCHFEGLAGGATYNSAIWIDGLDGGEITGNYCESSAVTFATFGSSVDGSTRGFEVGGNFITNVGSPAINADAARFCTFNPNTFIPGPISPNANMLLIGASGQDCVIHPQRLVSGSGAAVSVTGGALRITRIDLKPAVVGSRGGNAALASALANLAALGYIVDSTTA